MRILHTSDWHLGRELAGHSRASEHEAFLDELVSLAAGVDLVIVSGDVFEAYNPPIAAEELYFDALARLGDGGRRAVVVIAGNHDSPDRLAAAGPLATRHGVFVLGRPGAVAPPLSPRAGRVAVTTEPSLLRVALPSGERAVVAALPYPSEARLRDLLSPSTSTASRQVAYQQRLARVWSRLCASFEPGAVNLATSHLSVSECLFSQSERSLVGGAYQVRGDQLPAGADYVALGHLHAPQRVASAPSLTRYAGAPFAFRMSESELAHSHCIVEITAGHEATVELLPISAGRPLVRWQATSVAEVIQGVQDGLYANAFIELTLRVDDRLDHTQLATLKRLPRDFTRIRAVLPEASDAEPIPRRSRHELPIRDLFRAFHRDQTGAEPSSALVDLFVEIVGDGTAEPAPAAQPATAPPVRSPPPSAEPEKV